MPTGWSASAGTTPSRASPVTTSSGARPAGTCIAAVPATTGATTVPTTTPRHARGRHHPSRRSGRGSRSPPPTEPVLESGPASPYRAGGPGGRGCAKGNRVIASADIVMIVLRFFHIVGGALWVGSAFLFVAVIGPSAAEVGPSAGPLLQVAVKKRKVAQQITIFGASAVIAGWLMWLKDLKDYDWNVSNWVFHSGGFGLALTLGGILATIAFYEGYFHVGKG